MKSTFIKLQNESLPKDFGQELLIAGKLQQKVPNLALTYLRGILHYTRINMMRTFSKRHGQKSS